eukprot:TRINITY_DN3754_c0_g2_i2.p2 TRINITY_DN3754_c0_g2~~TRINITY_DN3754_c0_g2_i2.p2  ORF type:complete len:107 (+),score=9.50 TRINITY_DN3754_c0_g2_i2:279-599(+)
MRMLHSSRVPDDTNCMDVQICERAFEAKLTVCKCAIKRLSENFLRTSLHFEVSNLITVIFSPRMNENIDIETGKTIRIHSPWKHIQLADNKIIILCTYFCEMTPYS